MVIVTTLGFIDTHRALVSTWTSRNAQVVGLEGFLSTLEDKLMKSTNHGLPRSEAHTGQSLRDALARTVSDNRRSDSKNINELFSEGLDVLDLRYLVDAGLRLEAAEADDKSCECRVEPKSLSVLIESSGRINLPTRRR